MIAKDFLLVNVPMIPHAEWKTACISKKMIATDMVELRLARPESFSYAAGQFVQFIVPADPAPVLRAYSIASHPGETTLEFCMKLMSGGRASTFFTTATSDTEIRFSGPNGKFTCSSERVPLSFVATGAGLAPIWGIISDELINKKNTEPMHLIFGIRSEEDIFWADRLDSLAKRYLNFSYTLTLSQPGGAWAGKTGRVTTHMRLLPSDSDFFLCGNVEMVKDVRAMILEKNIPPTRIHFEIF